MGDARIKISKDKAELVQSLLISNETTGPFQTYADIIAFAAAIGFKYQHKLPLNDEISKRDPAPIHRETFAARGYEMIFNLIAIADFNDPKILASSEEYSSQRLAVFEEYINGGLEILSELLKGSVDYSEKLLLELNVGLGTKAIETDEFDLSNFL